MDILVCMAGTGGTGFGTASYLRSRNPNLQVVLVQPHPDSRLTPEHPDAQIIDGVLPAYDVPESALSDYLRPDWSDACINVRTEEAYETAHEVLRVEELFLGTSAAAALHAAVQVGPDQRIREGSLSAARIFLRHLCPQLLRGRCEERRHPREVRGWRPAHRAACFSADEGFA